MWRADHSWSVKGVACTSIATWRPSRKRIRTSDRRARSGVKRSAATLMTSGWRLAQSASTALRTGARLTRGGVRPLGPVLAGRRSAGGVVRLPGRGRPGVRGFWVRRRYRRGTGRRPGCGGPSSRGRASRPGLAHGGGLRGRSPGLPGNEQIVLQRWLLRAGPAGLPGRRTEHTGRNARTSTQDCG